MRMKLLAVLLAAAACAPAHAQQPQKQPQQPQFRPPPADHSGLYVIGTFGVSQGNDSSASLARATADVGAITSSTVEAKRYNGSILVGYRFNEFFGIEGGFADLGRISLQAAGAGGSFTSTAKIRGAVGGVVGHLPINDDMSVYGRVGLVYARTAYESNEPFKDTSNATRAYWGLGLQMDIDRNLFARLEYTRFNNLGSTASGQGAYNHYVAGIGYLFR
ncbi:MAG: outer membrane beta-barrel protein [Betaproteobacteria bacterium]|jgi:OOP family OmpA-OmpF porin